MFANRVSRAREVCAKRAFAVAIRMVWLGMAGRYVILNGEILIMPTRRDSICYRWKADLFDAWPEKYEESL